jgi:hypothetical protein
MSLTKNPFEYEAASNLSTDEILSFYIEDHNFSRFIDSSRNIFLTGERGTGKTMTLLYHSFKIQSKKTDNQTVNYSKIGIHIPCKTPLIYKKEYELLSESKAYWVSEHYLSLFIVHEIAVNLMSIPEVITAFSESDHNLKDEFSYITGSGLHASKNFLESIELFVKKEIIETQRKINDANSDAFYSNTYSFNSLVLPLINMVKSVPAFQNAHFMLMIDDAHDLNDFQTRILNSWIAYRDHSDYSFKVAITSEREYHFKTASGGSIIEGHDFTKVERENPYRNSHSEFGQMAKQIIDRRLQIYYGDNYPDANSFFPMNPELKKDLERANKTAKVAALKKFPNGTSKQINDYIYKYGRAEYFKSRATKSNLPPYSGFETIVQLSTGVIRNLLAPCYEMFEMALSEERQSEVEIKSISWTVQSRAIENVSKKKWESTTQLNKTIEGCSEVQTKAIGNLLNRIAILLKRRLLSNLSEPRALKFIITEKGTDAFKKVEQLLAIAQKAQLIYARIGRSKDDGQNTTYYELNRLLLPDRGLDANGQHSIISLKASVLLAAAMKNKDIPFKDESTTSSEQTYFKFFDE